jgi:hypothetical protein
LPAVDGAAYVRRVQYSEHCGDDVNSATT